MDLFVELFGSMLAFVYHCFDRIVIHGYLSSLSRPDQVVYFFRQVVGVPVVSKEVLSRRTADYQSWVEAFARNHKTPIEWAEKGVRKEEYVRRWQRSMERRERFGVYFILYLQKGTGHSALHIIPTAWPREGWVVARKGQAGRREVGDMR